MGMNPMQALLVSLATKGLKEEQDQQAADQRKETKEAQQAMLAQSGLMTPTQGADPPARTLAAGNTSAADHAMLLARRLSARPPGPGGAGPQGPPPSGPSPVPGGGAPIPGVAGALGPGGPPIPGGGPVGPPPQPGGAAASPPIPPEMLLALLQQMGLNPQTFAGVA